MQKESAGFTLGGVHGKRDVKAIKRELDGLPGVSSVSVNSGSGLVTVDFDTSGTQKDRIEKQLESMGYEILEPKRDDHDVWEESR